jgi:hypothetical protein
VSTCGLWLGAQRLVAVIVEDDGRLHRPIRAAPTPAACAALFDWLSARDVRTLVISERSPTLIAQAQAAHLHVVLAPHPWLEAIRTVAGYTRRPHRDSAALLARWSLTPGLRNLLHECRTTDAPAQQMSLL